MKDESGYVYLIRFNHCKNCYKIGSTKNVLKRLKAFGNRWHDVDLIAHGYTDNKLETEIKLQEMFHEFSNNHIIFKLWPKIINFQFAGDITSNEYFIFNTANVCDVIVAFEYLCDSVQIGSNDPVYGINPKCISIGYGEELQKFYDPSQDAYVPYPTEFVNGYPIYKDAEEWDRIRQVTTTQEKYLTDWGVSV